MGLARRGRAAGRSSTRSSTFPPGLIPATAGPHLTGMTTCIEKEEAWWSANSAFVHFIDRDRYCRAPGLVRTQRRHRRESAPSTPKPRRRSSTPTSRSSACPTSACSTRSGEFIWFSQRDGWGHLYLHDLRHRRVERPHHHRRLGGARPAARGHAGPHCRIPRRRPRSAANPYHRTLCRANLDGTGFTVLTHAMTTSRSPCR